MEIKNFFCEKCFSNPFIVNYIRENGKVEQTKCGYCFTNGDFFIIEVEKILPILEKTILKIYEYNEHYSDETYSYGNVLDYRAGYIKSLEDIFIELFGFKSFVKLIPILEKSDDIFQYMDILNSNFRSICGYGVDLNIIDWRTFQEHTKYKARYFEHNDYSFSVRKALERFDEFFSLMKINCNQNIYRARKIIKEQDELDIKSNPSSALGKAPSFVVKNNRFSPIGISYGYFSFDKTTAIKEIRANITDRVAIGKFKLDKQLELVDLREKSTEKFLNPFLDSFDFRFYCISEFIGIFVDSISKPILDKDSLLEYVPTQIMSEYIWAIGYDGFLFDSSQEYDGVNIVLFGENPYFDSYEIT